MRSEATSHTELKKEVNLVCETYCLWKDRGKHRSAVGYFTVRVGMCRFDTLYDIAV